jgi:DNA polymerase delta subunit 1
VLQIDVLQILRRETKHASYTLNNMAKEYLGDAKIDLPAHEIFSRYDGSSADRAVIAGYAAKDTVLPLQLLKKLCMFENILEMANATYCPADYIMNRGQQIRVYSVLMRKARSLGFACPDGVGIGTVGKFAGATVLEAKTGAYFDPVVCLDFASLYPSIIRAHRLDYSTLVLDPAYDNLPGVTYHRVAIEAKGDTPGVTYAFAQTADAVLPSLLEDLAAFRKQAKRDMADARARGDAFAEALANSRQLAFKVTMNSAYGFAGTTNGGMLSCVPIAESVTATGRLMIQQTKRLVESLVPGSRVIYGDTGMRSGLTVRPVRVMLVSSLCRSL